MTRIFSFFIALTFAACQPGQDSVTSKFQADIDEIKSDAQLHQYLMEIEILDQKYRKMESAIAKKYGNDSQEHQEVWEMINLTDQQNLLKVNLILEKFGYPQKSKVGEAAAGVPIMVVHHAADYNLRVEYTDMFYDAWKAGDIRDVVFALFLERMHLMKYDKYFSYPSPYKHEEKIDAMLTKLNLK